MLCICVLRAVVQSLLNDPVHARFVFLGQAVRDILFHKTHQHSRALGYFARLPFERRNRPMFRPSVTEFSASVLMFSRACRYSPSLPGIADRRSTSISSALRDW